MKKKEKVIAERLKKKKESMSERIDGWEEKEGRKFGIRYPKFLLLAVSFIVAFFLFKYINILHFDDTLISLGYFGTFIIGMLFAYGFTAAPATALFLIIADSQNVFLAVLVGAIGACISDYLIFKLIKTKFTGELRRFEKEKIVREIDEEIPLRFRHFLALMLAEIMIISPLPNEIGIAMLAMEHHMTKKKFIAISFALSLIGIGIILLLGRVI